MRIFLSYSSHDRPTAERINLALEGAGHDVFFDRTSLPPGDTFDIQIIDAIDHAELFVFLISPEAVAQGTYALTELGIARRKWPRPGGRVLPVMLRRMEIASLPPYLRAVTILEPEGEVGSEVVSSVDRLAHRGRRRLRRAFVWTVPPLVLAAIGYASSRQSRHDSGPPSVTSP
jgi:TIR domain-containing protein